MESIKNNLLRTPLNDENMNENLVATQRMKFEMFSMIYFCAFDARKLNLM